MSQLDSILNISTPSILDAPLQKSRDKTTSVVADTVTDLVQKTPLPVAKKSDKAQELSVDPQKAVPAQTLIENNEATHEVKESGIVGKLEKDALPVDGTPQPPDHSISLEQIYQQMGELQNNLRGILLDRPSPSVDDMKAMLDKLDLIQETLDSSEQPFLETAMADVFTMQAKLNTAIVSRQHCEQRLADLDRLAASDRPHDQKLESMLETYSKFICRAGRLQTQALRDLVSGRPELADPAMEMLKEGVAIVGTDLMAFETRLAQAMAAELKATLPAEDNTPQNMLVELCRLSLASGADPRAMLDILSQAPQWTSPAHMTKLVEVLRGAYDSTMFSSLEGSTPRQRAEMLRFVDMLFQGAKFEASLEVLSLKKMLLPDHQAEAELQDSCALTTSHLLNHMIESIDGDDGKGKTRTAALRHGAGGVSAHSFLLTPELVQKLHAKAKVDVEDFNYHLAHVALLQKKAVQMDLIPATQDQLDAMTDMENWCLSLGISKSSARYAGELDAAFARENDADQRQLLLNLQGASRQFVRGFSGTRASHTAASLIAESSGMSNLHRHTKREAKIYHSSDDFVAHKALDLFIVNLSAMGDARFTEGSKGLDINGDAVSENIRIEMQLAMAALIQNDQGAGALLGVEKTMLPQELESLDRMRENLEQRAQTQKALTKRLSAFNACREGMQTMEQACRLADMARTAGRDIFATRKEHFETRENIRFSWLHQHPERKRVCHTLLRFAAVNSELEQLRESLAENRLQGEEHTIARQREAELEHDLADCLDQLKGVHPTRLVKSSKLAEETPSLEVILKHMLPRARAMSYFSDKTVRDAKGKLITQAKADLRQLKELRSMMKEQQKTIDKGKAAFFKLLGTPLAKRVTTAVSAAALKVFVESGHTPETFDIHAEGVRDSIDAQLREWGLEPQKALIRLCIGNVLRSITTHDGRLDMDHLRAEVKKQDLDLAKAARKEQAQLDGRSTIRAWYRAKREVNAMLASEERLRAQGIHSLMNEASVPGCGFVYDCSRGLVLDTGSIFSPLSGEKSLLTKTNATHPLSLRFQAMHDNSITVMRGPNGTFSVTMKGGTSASLAATLKLSAGNVMGIGSAGGGGSSCDGVELTFKDQQDAELFLREFMTPDSKLSQHRSRSSWQAATRVRLIDGLTVSGNIGGGVSVTTFAQAIGNSPGIGGEKTQSILAGLGLNISASGSVGHSSSKNVHGETVTITRGWKATASLSATTSLKGQTGAGKKTLTTIPKLNQTLAGSVDFEDRWRLDVGETGIMDSTRLETSCPANRVSNAVLRLLLLPSELRAALEENPRFYDEFFALVRDLPPTARLVVNRKLKEAVLKEVRELFLAARMAQPQRKKELLDKAHTLLASKASYSSATLTIRNVDPKDISRNWSPGLGPIQYKRHSGFGVITSGREIEIPLPAAAETEDLPPAQDQGGTGGTASSLGTTAGTETTLN